MASLSKGHDLSSSLKEEVIMVNSHNQGIVSILGLDSEMTKTPSSLRRTLSADMSSKQWQIQHGLTPLKKIASSEELSLSSSTSGEEEEQIKTFQSSTRQEEKKQQQLDIWSLIISQKEKDPKKLPPPYIHPLVKRSASSMSQKSLQICTESLGSETGSDGYSSYQSSEGEVDQEEQEQVLEPEKLVQEYNDFPMTKYRKSQHQPIRCFPPPVTSLASNRDGVSLQMRSRRANGRLVLEAVSIASQKNFSCRRQDGRLVLSLMNNPPAEEEEEEEEKDEDEDEEEEEEEEEEEAEEEDCDEQFEVEIENGEATKEEVIEEDEEGDEEEAEAEIYKAEVLPSGFIISVHRLALTMNKKVLANKYNEVVKMGLENGGEEEKMVVERISINPVLTQSLPPRTPYSKPTKAAASYNAYEYYWKQKSIIPAKVSGFGPITQNQTLFLNDKYSNNDNTQKQSHMAKERQEVLLLRGNKGDYLVKGCKEPRKSLLVWEPHCMAIT